MTTHAQLLTFDLGMRVHPAIVAVLTVTVLALALALTLVHPATVIADPVTRNVL